MCVTFLFARFTFVHLYVLFDLDLFALLGLHVARRPELRLCYFCDYRVEIIHILGDLVH